MALKFTAMVATRAVRQVYWSTTSSRLSLVEILKHGAFKLLNKQYYSYIKVVHIILSIPL